MFLIRKTFKNNVATNLHLRAGLWGLWVVNLISLLFFGISESRNFSMGTSISQRVILPEFESDTIYINKMPEGSNRSHVTFGPFKLNDKGLVSNDIHYRFVRSDSDELELSQINSSSGRTVTEAENNAQAINYDIEATSSEIKLPGTFPILKGSKYRGQDVEIVFKVPVGKTVKFSRGISNRIYEFDQDRNADNPWRSDGKYFWTMTNDGFVAQDYIRESNQQKSYDNFKDFTQLQFDGPMKINIEQSNDFEILVKSKDHYLEKLDIDQLGNLLTINLDVDHADNPPVVTIKMPMLNSYDGKDTRAVNISGFTQSGMLLKSDGRNDLSALISVDSLIIRQDGRTNFDLRGKGRFLKVSLDGESRLKADRYNVAVAELKMDHNNSVTLSVSDTLYKKGNAAQHSSRLEIEGEPAVVELE